MFKIVQEGKMDTAMSIEKKEKKKFEVSGYRFWLQQQCKKAGGHTYTMRSRWGISWTECICCGKRIRPGEVEGEEAGEEAELVLEEFEEEIEEMTM